MFWQSEILEDGSFFCVVLYLFIHLYPLKTLCANYYYYNKSTIAEHIMNDHSILLLTIGDFNIDFLHRQNDTVRTRIAATKAIDHYKPALNRKHELMNSF